MRYRGKGTVLEVEVSGDLDGSVRWELSPEPAGTRMEFEQRVRVTGLLALGSYVARPLLRWNHHRMMLGCVAGLTDRLDREPGGRASPT